MEALGEECEDDLSLSQLQELGYEGQLFYDVYKTQVRDLTFRPLLEAQA